MKITQQIKFSSLYEIVLPLYNYMQLFLWLNGKSTQSPRLIKQKIIRDYANKNSIRTFIETGTYLGETVNAIRNTFSTIYTMEIDEKLYRRARKKFAGVSKIKIYSGDSGELLPKILKKINKPCLFWLDAHFSAGITSKGEKYTPILEELNCILSHQERSHVILIDDAEYFNGKGDYPTIKSLRDLVKRKRPKMRLEVIHNLILISP